MTYIIVFVLFFVACTYNTVLQVNAPLWPSTFKSQIFQYSDSTYSSGTYWYDFTNNRQRIDRSNTYTDEICNSLLPNKTSLCTNIYVNNKRFIMFPNQKICCQCCTVSQIGCSILPPNWLQNATFKGIIFKNWDQYNHWLLKNEQAQIDYYQASYIQTKEIDRTTNNKFTSFQFDTENKSAIQDSIFSLPSYCRQNKLCPKQSSCNKFVQYNQISQSQSQ